MQSPCSSSSSPRPRVLLLAAVPHRPPRRLRTMWMVPPGSIFALSIVSLSFLRGGGGESGVGGAGHFGRCAVATHSCLPLWMRRICFTSMPSFSCNDSLIWATCEAGVNYYRRTACTVQAPPHRVTRLEVEGLLSPSECLYINLHVRPVAVSWRAGRGRGTGSRSGHAPAFFPDTCGATLVRGVRLVA
jgi:hypothetical protein